MVLTKGSLRCPRWWIYVPASSLHVLAYSNEIHIQSSEYTDQCMRERCFSFMRESIYSPVNTPRVGKEILRWSMAPHMTTVFSTSIGELLCQRNYSSVDERAVEVLYVH
jgi:hypothetical protein